VCLGFGLLALRHTDVQAVVDSFVSELGINPEAHYPRLFIEHLANIGDSGLSWFALLALLSSVLRFTEAIGLWFEKHWAEWLTLIGASLYLPFEVAHMIKKLDWFGGLILGINLIIVGYLAWVLVSQRRERLSRQATTATESQTAVVN
jgi:uncharacterized membrane protein (DUF2068 family)